MTIANDLVHPDAKKRRYNAVSVRAAYTARVDDLVACKSSVTAITVTLPATVSAGACVAVGDDDDNAETNPITVAAAASIDGEASLVFSSNGVIVEFMYTGSTWRRLVSTRDVAAVGGDLPIVSIADLRKAMG